jgi:hypothetical protein
MAHGDDKAKRAKSRTGGVLLFYRIVSFSGYCPLAVLLVFILLGSTSSLRGHLDANAIVPNLRALKVDAPITVDGVLDEPFWRKTPASTGFFDSRTQLKAELQTVVRVAYTRTNLYIAVECFDDRASEVRATERREDRSFDFDDWVEVHLDPMHSHQSKYAFFSNPLGTRSDANEGPSGVFNRGWSADWQLAAKIETNRWVFEMCVPFSALNYQRANGQVWGLNFTRMVRRTDATSFWSFSSTDVYKPRNFGHLTGLELKDTVFSRNWEYTPYVSARTDFHDKTDTTINAGMDVSFRLTPSITSAITVKPDFGQVESDANTIELTDTERFLEEKRLFFREGDELMRMNNRLYYSRRFTDIDGGAQFSGQLNDYKFAFVDVFGQVSHDGFMKGNSGVLRVLKSFNERSNLGGYLSSSEFDRGHSRVAGHDGYVFLSDAWRVRYQVAGADEQTSSGDEGQFDGLGATALIYNSYPWETGFGANAIGRNFNPALGYIPRRDIMGPTSWFSYNPTSDKLWYKSLYLGYDTQYYWDHTRRNSVHDHHFYARPIFQNDLGINLGHDQNYHAPFHNPRTTAGVVFHASDYWKSITLGYARGRFERMNYNEASIEKHFKFIERMPIRYELVARLEEPFQADTHVAWLNRIVFDFYFTKTMWLKSSIQHRDSSIHNLSFIYGWEFKPRTYWYLVLNNVANTSNNEASSIFTKLQKTF